MIGREYTVRTGIPRPRFLVVTIVVCLTMSSLLSSTLADEEKQPCSDCHEGMGGRFVGDYIHTPFGEENCIT